MERKDKIAQIKTYPTVLEIGPCIISWDWEEKDLVSCYISYEEPGTTGYILVGKHWARCSEEDWNKGLFSEQFGMRLSLKKAMQQWRDRPHSFRQKVWFAFRDKIGFPKPRPEITNPLYKVPKDFIGRTFFYKGENYTVTNIVWGKAPRARNQSTKGYWKKGETPGSRKWVEYVEYESHKGMDQRFVRPKSEFLNKFGITELKENVRIVEDFPTYVDPTPKNSAFDNFE